MVQATELKVGNLVYAKYEKHYIKVASISLINNEGISEINGWEDKELDPIQLAPEILRKLGFLHHKGKWNEWWDYSNFTLYNEDYKSKKHYEFKELYYDIIIMSVHQLQNFYNSISGKELEINL
jgi:hypothetical protein